MIRSKILVYGISLLSAIGGILNILLYFYNLVPEQIPTGSPFYLRMGIIFLVGVPMVVQFLSRMSPAQRPKVINALSLVAVLVFAIFLMSLLLPLMTKTLETWDG